ncbi:MAG: pyruvate kinase [Gloeomargarita sp. SKYBB_i_bin120]|nr:pyruvate kinase [Gloeomargarita sp. SKYB120]MDW8179021.1 pyruvate kinase [Gloeomargarita sp. SKYBB_i_bin120]
MAASFADLIQHITQLRDHALYLENAHQDVVAKVAPAYQASARNLLHYLALRQHDVRELQDELAALGLSSLGRCEAHTLHTLEQVLRALHCLAGRPSPPEVAVSPVTFADGQRLLKDHSRELFGEPPAGRHRHIMVTMPTEAATQPQLVAQLLAAGMDIMRINCAHDEPAIWLRMIENLRQAQQQLGRPCKVCADLCGPKLRTGSWPGVQVLKLRPKRDLRGRVVAPAQAWLVAEDAHPSGMTGPVIPVQGDLVAQAQGGDEITLKDAAGRHRCLRVVAVQPGCVQVTSERTVYLETGLTLKLQRRDERLDVTAQIGFLPPRYEGISLQVGDVLRLVRATEAADPTGHPPTIPCDLGDAFTAIQPGQRIWFDDGKIGGRVVTNDGQSIGVEITTTRPGGDKLRPEKGINLPDTDLNLPALTQEDRKNLALLAPHIDLVGLSFVRTPDDVRTLTQELSRLAADHVGIILKIENHRAFENLPWLLLASMERPPVGVMVARGDLAVEVGFERLAEVQEEILWLCEAAHVPVIWATQVLESMAKTGMPSRAEVSDAVMSERAECVMLNKGPYIVEATRFLVDVLERMAAHQAKKRARLRSLAVARI